MNLSAIARFHIVIAMHFHPCCPLFSTDIYEDAPGHAKVYALFFVIQEDQDTLLPTVVTCLSGPEKLLHILELLLHLTSYPHLTC